MKKFILYFTCIALIFASTASAKDYAGSYVLRNETGVISLTLQKDERAGYRGNLTANGKAFDLWGIVQNGLLTGTFGDDLDALMFQAELKGNDLTIIVVEADDNNNPIPGTAEKFVLQRQSAVKKDTAPKKTAADKEQIFINDVILSKQQILEFEKTYGIQPRPGKYWYDSKSGLYGGRRISRLRIYVGRAQLWKVEAQCF